MSILTVGCSFTQGEELLTPTQSAWPAVLGKLNNQTVKNMGMGGSSNERIFRLVIEETSKQLYDLVVVQWSEPSRLEVWWDRANGPVNVNVNSNYSKMAEFDWLKTYYQKHYNDTWAHKKWLTQILALQGYLKSIDQPYAMVGLSGIEEKPNNEDWNSLTYLRDQVDTKYYPGWPYEGIYVWQGDCPRGPKGHPLELGHERIAEKINEHIRNIGWVSRRSSDSNQQR